MKKKIKNVLIIDAQLLQTNALHRGMGKYTIAFLNEYKDLTLPYDKVMILMNNTKLKKEEQDIIDKSLINFDIVQLPLTKTDPRYQDEYKNILESNRHKVDKYINENFAESNVDFLITALFQEDSCPAFPTHANNKYLLIYDLIPLQFPHYYLKDEEGKSRYLSRFKELFNATHYFTISQTVADDLAIHLGVPLNKITPINGSYISRKKLSPERPRMVDTKDKFILMPTGDDARKNNLRATMAFEEFNSRYGYQYKLVVTSFFSEKTKKELQLQSNHLIFTGNVREEELAWLYDNADLIFFPSEYEGLGMPPLEGVEFNKKVLCSSIDVFKEISEDAFYYCDPYDIHDTSYELQKALVDESGETVNVAEYKRILKDYSWKHTAERMIQTYKKNVSNVSPKNIKKQKIAIFAPDPSGYSAIGKVVQEQFYELSQHAEIDYYLEQGISDKAKGSHVRINFLSYVANCKNPWSFNTSSYSKYDKVIYNLGNSEYHIATVIKALAYPGTIILHDSNLSGLYEIITGRGYITGQRHEYEKLLEESIKKEKSIAAADFNSSCIASLTNASKKVVVHSQYALRAVEQVRINDSTKLLKLNLPTPVPYAIYPKDSKESTFTLGYAGIIHQAKGIDIIESIATTIHKKPILVKLFGFSLMDDEILSRLEKFDNIQIIQSPSDTRFIYELKSCNAVVNFRPNYHGETSLSTIETLRIGGAVITNDVGWFSELPDNVLYRVTSGGQINNMIDTIIDNDGQSSADKRHDYIKKYHSADQYINGLVGKA